MPEDDGTRTPDDPDNFLDAVPLPMFIADFSPFLRALGTSASGFLPLLGSDSPERLRIVSGVRLLFVNEEGGRLLAERVVPGKGYVPWERLAADSWKELALALDGFLEGRTTREFPVSFLYPSGFARSYSLRLHLPEKARADWSRVIACITRVDQPGEPPATAEGDAFLRQLFSNMLLGFALIETTAEAAGPSDFRFLSVNPAFERITGFERSSTVGRTAGEVMPNLDPESVRAFVDVVRTGKPFFFQGFTYDRKQYFDVWAYRPALGRLAAFIQDVSEREQGIRDIRRQRESLDLALDAAGAGTWSLDLADGSFLADERCAALMGRSPRELGPDLTSWEALIHPGDLPAYRDRKRRCLEGETDRYECELRGRRGDGRWIWFLERGTVAERDYSGRPRKLIGTLINQDRRKRAELEASEKGSRLTSLLDSLDDVALFTDRDGVLQGCNRALERLLGLPFPDIVGKRVDEFFEPAIGRAMRERNERVLAGEAPVRAEEWHRSAETGQRTLLEIHKNPLRDEEGNVVGIATVARDITERHDVGLVTSLRLALLERSRELPSPALARFALGELGRITGSAGGFLYGVSDGTSPANLLACTLSPQGSSPAGPAYPPGFEAEAASWAAVCARERRVVVQDAGLDEIRSPQAGGKPGWKPGCFRCVLAPILRRGRVVAVLGVVDKEESYSARDISLVCTLAESVWDALEIQISAEKRAESEWVRETALNVTKAGFWTSLVSTGEGMMDDRCSAILGRPPSSTYLNFVETWKELCHPEDLDPGIRAMEAYLRGESPIFEVEMRLRHRDGHWIWVLDRGEVIERDPSGFPVRMAGIVVDVTRLKESELRLRETLADKEALIGELHHRSNNTMQLINAMLEFKKAELDYDLAIQGISSVQNKIIAISLVQEKLFQANSLSSINLGEFLRDLAGLLQREMVYRRKREHSFEVDVRSVNVSIDSAIPCGIIVAELIENSVRHAFPDGMKGIVRLKMSVDENDWIRLEISDNGQGPPKGFDPRFSKKVGLQTVIGIAEGQLHGSVQFKTSRKGFSVFVRFKDAFPRRV